MASQLRFAKWAWAVACWMSVAARGFVALDAPAADTAAAPEGNMAARFRLLDRNGDGKLTTNELNIRRLFKFLDQDNDGVVTREEAEDALPGAAARRFDRANTNKPAYSTSADENSPRQGPRRLKASEHGVGAMMPDVEFIDIDGRRHRLSEFKNRRAVVIAVTSTSCPLSRRYAPTLAKLEREFGTNGVAFVFLNPVTTDSDADIRASIRTHGLAGPYVHDKSGAFAAALGARSTTEALVIDAARTLVYRGAVDDQYGLGYSLAEPRQRYLTAALEAVLRRQSSPMAATTAPGCALDTAKAKTSSGTKSPDAVTYHNRISRIVQNNCLECHRTGGVAPFSLERPEDVAAHAGMIRRQVERGLMPPWFAAPEVMDTPSPWANDRALATRDRADLLAWLDRDRPLGNVADAPVPRVFPETWAMGEPDAVFQIPKPIEVAATGVMPYQNVTVDLGLTEDKWVQSVEVLPTAREVVHHILVFVRPPGDKDNPNRRAREGDDERGGFFAVYVPGNNVQKYPEGWAKLLPAGAKLRFQIHYTPNGTATRDQVRLGLRFAKQPPEHIVRVVGLVNPLLSIPPGADDHAETASIPVLRDAKVMALMPHMHLRGKAFRYEAVLPGGETRTLLDVPRYDFNWQLAYRYNDPLALPRGTRLRAIGWFDNSANNPANPDPKKNVHWGPQTTDEMMLGYVEFYYPDEKPARVARAVDGPAQ